MPVKKKNEKRKKKQSVQYLDIIVINVTYNNFGLHSKKNWVGPW
jgi:hypothetical protein